MFFFLPNTGNVCVREFILTSTGLEKVKLISASGEVVKMFSKD